MKHQFLWRMSRDTGAGAGGGGGTETLTMQDLLNPGKNKGPEATEDTPVATDATEVTVAADDPLRSEAVNEDGTIKDGYSVEDGKLVKAAAPDTEEEVTTDDVDYFTEVEKITGRPLELTDEDKETLPEGMDLSTPEGRQWLTTPAGTAWRENRVYERGAVDFETILMEKDPRGYAYLMHRQNGGRDEDFFGAPGTGFVLPEQSALATNADLQRDVYYYELLAKGNSEEEAQALVDIAIKGNKLLDKANAAWTIIEKAQKDQLAVFQQKQQQDTQRFEQAKTEFISLVEQQVRHGIGLVIPESEQAKFRDEVLASIRYDNGRFFLMQEVNPKNIKNVLEGQFIEKRGLDLNKIVTRKVGTKVAQGLRLKVQQEQQTRSGGSNTGGLPPGTVPLSQLWQ